MSRSQDLWGTICTHYNVLYLLFLRFFFLIFWCILSCLRTFHVNYKVLSLFYLSFSVVFFFCFCQLFSWWDTFISFKFHLPYFSLLCFLHIPLFHVANGVSASPCPTIFIFPLLTLMLLFCCQRQNECETNVSCEFTLFCTTVFVYAFVCYTLSWFINPSRLFKECCIT